MNRRGAHFSAVVWPAALLYNRSLLKPLNRRRNRINTKAFLEETINHA